jgi:FkbM family methyltransferase
MTDIDAICKRWDSENAGMVHNHVQVHSRLLANNIPALRGMIDIGSNTGLFYDAMKSKMTIDHCWMIEANMHLASYARSKYDSNSVSVVSAAIGNSNGVAYFFPDDPFTERSPNRHNLGLGRVLSKSEKVHSDCVQIPMITISSFLTEQMFETVDLIKIDTENMDFTILEDLISVIPKFKQLPIISFECNWQDVPRDFAPTMSPKAILETYANMGYYHIDDIGSVQDSNGRWNYIDDLMLYPVDPRKESV